jgi:lipopolysaccharide transport system permease protein
VSANDNTPGGDDKIEAVIRTVHGFNEDAARPRSAWNSPKMRSKLLRGVLQHGIVANGPDLENGQLIRCNRHSRMVAAAHAGRMSGHASLLFLLASPTLLNVTLATPAMRAPGSRSLRNGVQLLSALTSRDLRLRYQGSIFGWAWSLVRPLALGLILWFALGKVLGTGITAVFLLSGLFPWFWFQGAVQGATTTFVGNGGLLKKVRFPRAVLPLSIVTGNTLQFLFAAPVLAGFLIVSGYYPAWSWLVCVPLLFVIQLLLIAGLALFVASITVFFRDLEHISDVLLNLVFYATPIIYPASRIPHSYRWITWLNPLAPIMEGWHSVLLDGEWPGADLLAAIGWTTAAAALGWFTFRRLEDAFADIV